MGLNLIQVNRTEYPFIWRALGDQATDDDVMPLNGHMISFLKTKLAQFRQLAVNTGKVSKNIAEEMSLEAAIDFISSTGQPSVKKKGKTSALKASAFYNPMVDSAAKPKVGNVQKQTNGQVQLS